MQYAVISKVFFFKVYSTLPRHPRANEHKKITGRKRPALVDPSHKVRQVGKASVWDEQTYGRTDGPFQSTSGPLPLHFQSTSGSLPVHLGTIGVHMRHHSYSLPKK